MRTFFFVFIYLLFINNKLRAQETDENRTPTWELGIQLHHVELKHSFPFYRYNYATNSLYPNDYQSPFSNLKFNKNSHLYFGISVVKSKNKWFCRLRMDYFYNPGHSYSLSYTESANRIQEVESGFIDTGIQLAPGAGKTIYWKFISLKFGIELPVYFDWITKRWISVKEYTVNNPASWSEFTMILPPGGFVKLAAITGIDFHINNRFTIGVEFSSGMLFYKLKGGFIDKTDYYTANGVLYKTTTEDELWPMKGKFNMDLFAPSVNLSYRFQR